MGGFFIGVTQMEDSIEIQSNTEQLDQETETSTESSGSLSAGFAKVRGGEPTGATTESIEPALTADPAGAEVITQETVETKEPEVIPEEMFMGMPASQVKAILEKAAEFEKVEQRLYGKFGEFQKKLNAVQTAASSGQSISVTKEKLKRLSSDFPDLAELLADDLSDLLKSPASGIDQEQVNTLVSEKLQSEIQRIEAENEKKLLTMAHRDWRQVRDSAEWDSWLNQLPADRQNEIRSSWSAVDLADAITEHKQWVKEKADAEAKAAANAARRENKLANSVVPRGVPAAGPMKVPDSKGLDAGFKRVRG